MHDGRGSVDDEPHVLCRSLRLIRNVPSALYSPIDPKAVETALVQKSRAPRDELAGPNPTPLERIPCERVALCWRDANEMDRRSMGDPGNSYKEAAYRQELRDRAHKRFLAACKTLATVRRLGGPAVQINQVVGQQQVNVGCPAHDPIRSRSVTNDL